MIKSRNDLLIPVRRLTSRPGTFRWPAKAVLSSPRRADLLPLEQLAADLKAHLGVAARIERNAFGPGVLRLRRVKDFRGPEAYRMTIGPNGIEIESSGDAGAYYAVQTLRDWLGAAGRSLPACAIQDWPDFRRRGVYYDCSRGKMPTLATLKDLVERLAHWKINELQLYVENVFTFRRHPAIGRGYSPFTPQDILDLQDHCNRHHVRLVGSLASFGHMERILALPHYVHLGEKKGFWDNPGGSVLCPVDPRSIRFLAELYDEFVPLFQADDFNVCCDETFELGLGRSRRRARKLGVGRVYLEFLLKIHRLCQRHGKRMNAWADIVLNHPELLADVPRDVVMLNWNYSPTGSRIGRTYEIAEAGLPVVACPGTNSWLSNGGRLLWGMANIARFAKVGLDAGAEGVLNTDWGDYGHRNTLTVSLHNFAYGAARSWNCKGTVDEAFTRRFCRNAFGRRDRRFADALLALGSAHRAVGTRQAAGMIYTTLTPPMFATHLGAAAKYLQKDHWLLKGAEKLPLDGLERRHRELTRLGWPAPSEARGPFEAHAMAELRLAVRLEMAGCRSAAILSLARQGKAVPQRLLKQFAQEAREAIAQLKRIWMLRNRRSRLGDNVKGIRAAVREYPKAFG